MDVNFNELAQRIGQLVTDKNKAYGSAFQVSGELLKLIYPDGVKPSQYRDMLLCARILDKLMRNAHDKSAFSESPYVDIMGYALLGAAMDSQILSKPEDNQS